LSKEAPRHSGKTLTNWLLKNHSKPKSPLKTNNLIERFASLQEMKRPKTNFERSLSKKTKG